MPNIGSVHLEAGRYGPFSFGTGVDPFTRSLKLTLTQVGNWPTVSIAAIVNIKWDSGDEGIFYLPGVWKHRKNQNRIQTVVLEVSVPSNTVTTGEMTIDVKVPIDLSATLEISRK